MKIGLYVHFPFCRKKCDYCNFFSMSVDSFSNEENLFKKYTDSLIYDFKEHLTFLQNLEIDTIYLGGGTPSLCPPEQISSFIQNIRKISNVTADVEITMELNPEDLDYDRLILLQKAGINRMSLGVQTFNKKFASFIGRNFFLEDLNLLKTFFSVENLNRSVDLIFGIPGQTKNDLIADLKQLISFSPEHISAYMLSIENGTPLYKRFKKDDDFDKNQKELFQTLILFLKDYGYNHYEISNFAKNGYESKHNNKYWTFQPYIGLGPSSHSFYNDVRKENISSITSYLNKKVSLKLDDRSENASIVEFFLTGLRLLKGININNMEDLLKIKLTDKIKESIIKNEKDGYLLFNEKTGDLRLTDRGLFFLDYVVYQICESLL